MLFDSMRGISITINCRRVLLNARFAWPSHYFLRRFHAAVAQPLASPLQRIHRHEQQPRPITTQRSPRPPLRASTSTISADAEAALRRPRLPRLSPPSKNRLSRTPQRRIAPEPAPSVVRISERGFGEGRTAVFGDKLS